MEETGEEYKDLSIEENEELAMRAFNAQVRESQDTSLYTRVREERDKLSEEAEALRAERNG